MAEKLMYLQYQQHLATYSDSVARSLRAEFLLFKIPNPTLATCYSEIRPGDPFHSSFFASFQGVTPFGRTFCTFFPGSEQSICLVGNLTWCMSLFSSV